jgi:site-specific DNA recombinase
MNIHELEMYHSVTTDLKTEKKYYLIYGRKSEESEDRQVQSIDDQLRVAKQLIINKNLLLLDSEPFIEAKSAKKPGRPQFNTMIDLIYQRKDIKGIICWRLNRLSRNPKDEGTIRWLLQSGEIDEIVTPEKIYKQVDSDFLMAIEGAQAQRYINDLRKDIARGINSKLEKGLAPILAPAGYRNAREKRQGERCIEPHHTYFPLMRQIFDLALTGNYSVESLKIKAEKLGIRNAYGRIISTSQLYVTLKNPFYTGTRFIYGGKVHTNGVHQAMITDEEYDLVQEALASRAKPQVNIHKGFLNGLMRCGECGSMITFEMHKKRYKNGKIQEFYYYRCTKKNRSMRCTQPYMPVADMERQAMEYLKSIKLSPRFIEWGIKWLRVMHENQQTAKEARLETSQKEYNTVDKKISNLIDLMIAGIVTPKEGAVKKQKLEDEKARLFAILSKIESVANEWTNLSIQTLDFVKTAQEKFESGTVEQKKTILKVIGSNLVVKDKKLDITIRTPFSYIQSVVSELKGQKIVDLPVITGQEAFLGSSDKALC